MPNIDLSFQGWICGANIETAVVLKKNTDTGDPVGSRIDVSDMNKEEFIDKLNSGELAITLTDALNDCNKSECELFDYE